MASLKNPFIAILLLLSSHSFDFKVASIPQEFSQNNELAEISLKYEVKDQLIEANATYFFKKSRYEAADYANIKQYFDQIVRMFNEQLVLEEM